MSTQTHRWWVGSCGSGGLANSSTPSLQLARNKSQKQVCEGFSKCAAVLCARAGLLECASSRAWLWSAVVLVLSWYGVFIDKNAVGCFHTLQLDRNTMEHTYVCVTGDVWPVGMLQTVRNLSTISSAARGMWKQPLLVKLSRQLKTVI